MSQQAVSDLIGWLGVEWKSETLDAIRVTYIRHLRGQAAGHKSDAGDDIVHERILTERVDRELKQWQLMEKRGELINVRQLEPALMQMVGAFRSEMLARDDKLKSELDALYGIDLEINLLNEHTRAALTQLAGFEHVAPE